MGAIRVKSNAGKEIKLPPPATELIAPAISAARKRRPASCRDTPKDIVSLFFCHFSFVRTTRFSLTMRRGRSPDGVHLPEQRTPRLTAIALETELCQKLELASGKLVGYAREWLAKANSRSGTISPRSAISHKVRMIENIEGLRSHIQFHADVERLSKQFFKQSMHGKESRRPNHHRNAKQCNCCRRERRQGACPATRVRLNRRHRA